jgi:hypothetical protein
MKKNILKETASDVRDSLECGLRAVCGKPSPEKRLVIVLIILAILSVTSVSVLVRSIYNIGKRDAELIHIEHLKQLELKRSADSINLIENIKNKDYEYDE